MQRSHFKRDFTTTFIGILVLLLGATLGVAQQAVNLTAAPTQTTLPDGSIVPLWGYSCDATQPTVTTATCAALSKNVTGWSPVIITVPSGQDLQINLTNALTFQPPTPSGGTAPAANTVPTSVVILGQLGGGLGNSATSNASPTHNNLSTTWPIASTGPQFVPPSQPNRVQSFATEVTAAGGQTSLTWKAPRPGTYLLESGTHPSIQVPMGLYGMVVVTAAPTSTSTGTAYPNVSYGAEVPLLFSEIDPTQNKSVTAAVTTTGFSEAATLGPFKSQPLSAISVVNGGHDYASAPLVNISGAGCTTVGGGTCPAAATATIDTTAGSPTFGQVTAITVTSTSNYTSSPTVVISGGGCTATPSNPCASADAVSQLFTSTYCSGGAAACYPAAVNYTPMYYLVNGQGFDKTNPTNSLFAVNQGASTGTVTGNVLVRMVNAGLKMHVPSIVGSQTSPTTTSVVPGLSLIAEDGNPLPGVTRVQNEVFMAAGKTYDVMINGEFTPPGTATTPAPYANALPIFDRELSLSGMSTNRDSGMLAYIGINGAKLPTTGTFSNTAAVARNDNYPNLIAGHTLVISDLTKGVIANDTNVTGVKVFTPPLNGQLSLNPNGTFTYTPSANGLSIALLSGGTNYTAPTVSIDPPPAGGTQATATASITSGLNVSLLNGGTGYVSPTVSIGPPNVASGTQATAVASFGISITLGSPGTGYITPVVSIDPPNLAGGTQATATAAIDASGNITSITVTNPGTGYTTVPNVSVTDSSSTSYTTTSATAAFTGVITGITVTNQGSGYTSAPSVSISDNAGIGASATASIAAGTGVVTAVNVTYIGSGYTAPPFVHFTDSTGNGASANATVVAGNSTSDSFVYEANGNPAITAIVTLGAATIEVGGITCTGSTYTASNAVYLSIKTPGVLANCKDAAGYPLTVDTTTIAATGGLTVVADANGGFTATAPAAGPYSFTFVPVNSQGTKYSGTVTASLTFPAGSGLKVTVLDGADHKTQITDYRWIIEEDRTFYMDPTCTTNPLPAGCPTVNAAGTPPVFGTNFHTSFMPVVATGCTGTLSCESGQSIGGTAVACDQGDGVCRQGVASKTAVDPSQVLLDPAKRYYISVLPGDAANPFNVAYAQAPVCQFTTDPITQQQVSTPNSTCGHGMGGAPIAKSQTTVTVLTEPSPYPPAKLTVFVFQDDYPLNGEHDAGGGVDVLAPNEAGLGGFEVTIADDAGGTGDATGQPTYDMFNQPLTNSLAGTIDPITNLDACPISTQATTNATNGDGSQKGIVGMVLTCPYFESDGVTLSPLAGQAIVPNLYPGRYGIIANPGADRIARGEEWLQTNTLDGQKAHDSFMRIGEPAYFQEYGPAGYHVTIGFANPQIINGRLAGVCAGIACNNTLTARVTTARMSRTPDERLYSSGSRDQFSFTRCYASLGDPDGANFAFTKCNNDGTFTMSGLPSGNWRLVIFDQWNDQIVDGIATPIALNCSVTAAGACSGTSNSAGVTLNIGDIATHQWQANIYTRAFIDLNKDGVSNKDASGNDTEPGLALVPTNVRYRDGSFSNINNTDLNGYASFNEVFPLFNWYVIETDQARYKTTGVHVVYDVGGPTDGTTGGGTSAIGNFFANTLEKMPLPSDLRIPGAVYCDAATQNADCTGASIAAGPISGQPSGPACTWSADSDGHGGMVTCASPMSSGRIDPPLWFGSYGWQGFSGQSNFLEFGKTPYIPGETGGIRGHVVYASTRPFDDPQFLLQNTWEPLVPHVTVNLYKEATAPDGTPSLTLIDTTLTSSFDDWAQGFRTDGRPNISCPGELPAAQTTAGPADPFWFGLENQPNYLDWYNSQHGGPAPRTLPYQSQFKCYDGMHQWNQLQPAPYDGMYSFPSVTSFNPTTGKPNGTNCTGCTTDPDASDPYRSGIPMLPAGKYVVEVVVPPGYDLVKEEDKNILIGDNFIAPVTSQFAGFGDVFILPDQAAIGATYNPNNPQNQTQGLGVTPLGGNDATKTQEYVWPCVGELRTVPDFISLFPQSGEVAPFAGATRHLCDRKEITLDDQSSAQAKFFIFTPTHAASHFTGVILDDFTAEFDPYSPQFGEKFAPSYLPVSLRDWAGNEVNRVYADMFGLYNGLNYSTWEVNPPNPTGYAPTMMVTCMNDPGTGATPDPMYQPNYSDFCYELSYMPGQTGYFDTPVTPTSAFSEGYNHPDCNYPDQTPAISQVTSQDIAGPWVSTNGHTITITSLGDQKVDNYGYVGPSATTAPFNQQKVNRHYGFGSCSPTNGVCTNGASVTIGGKPAVIQSWVDTQIVASVPNNVPACAVTQQPKYQGSLPAGQLKNAQCGQLLITNANGQQSVDTVTVTVGGKTPTLLGAGQTIQSALDAAAPGDMIIVPPGNYSELLIMWKPVRLQGVGAASSVVNANTHPAGKLDPWRAQIVCLFGLTSDGRPSSGPYAGCPGTGWTNLPGASAAFPTMVVDRVTLEAVLGWDANLNGNLAEQLIEPSLMGAYEGAAITVLGKGVNIPAGSADPFGSAAATVASFPTGTVLLMQGDCTDRTGNNPWPSNFYCNPSSIDGLTMTNSSQGGGGIFVHAWGHSLQIANNRVKNNSGTMSGGITVGQGEHIDALLGGTTPLDPPNSCESGVANQGLPFCYNVHVNVHNNSVTLNTSLGDELFSSTPAGAGGVTFCNGADYYKFNNNWVCGNMSTGDGGGFAHVGFIKNGDVEHNSFLFNQSQNPTITTNGGGLLVMGAPDADPPCGIVTDQDCLASPSSILPSDGTGPGLVINANLIMGNSADAGSGGGLRMQQVNGTDVLNNPNGRNACQNVGSSSCLWNSVTVTNNIITNNVAGWDGAGVSLQDAMAVNIVNNTIVSNDTTASSGTLFGSLFAPLASNPGINCTTPDGTYSCPQVAGLVSTMHSPVLSANMALLPANSIKCPTGHANCASISDPLLTNNLIWQNRSFVIGVGGAGSAATGKNQQNVVTLYNAAFPTSGSSAVTPTIMPGSQGVTGQCITGSSYWDIGVRNDLGPALHYSGFSLTPTYSVLTDATDYATGNNLGSNPSLVSQYCNGSRVPPENGGPGYTVYPGTNETSGGPTWLWAFNLTPSATVDEGNNWINMRWGPLALANPKTGVTLGNYAPAAGSPVINVVPQGTAAYAAAPSNDFFGNPRKTAATGNVDIGAVEVQGVAAPTLQSITPGNGLKGDVYSVSLTGTGFASGMTVAVSGNGVTVSNVAVASSTSATATFTIAPTAAGGARNVSVTVTGSGTSNNVTFTVQAPPNPTLTSVVPNTGVRGTSVNVTLTGTNFTTAGTTVNINGVGVTATGVTVVNSTTITATFVITTSAGLGNHNVSVTNPTNNSGNVGFSVTGPTVTSITPATGARGATVNVSIAGTGLSGATSVTVSGTGVTVSNFAAVNATTVTATFTIAANAPSGNGSGLRTVTVVTPTGSPTINFRVTAATLTISAPSPTLAPTGTPNTLTKTGTITVSNTATGGTAGPFTFSAAPTVAKVGAPGGTFSIVTGTGGGSCVNGAVVNPGSNCTIVVQYAPGSSTATATGNVSVTGSGISPATQTGSNFSGN